MLNEEIIRKDIFKFILVPVDVYLYTIGNDCKKFKVYQQMVPIPSKF